MLLLCCSQGALTGPQERTSGALLSMPAGARARPAALDAERQAFAPGYHLVCFRAPAGRAERAWLDALTGAPRRADGTSLARWYLPDDSWCVWVADEATLAALRARATVACVVPYGWRLKLDPTLRDLPRGREATLEVELVPGHDAVHLAQELTRAGGRVLEHVELRGRREHDLSFFLLAARRGPRACPRWRVSRACAGSRRTNPTGSTAPA